jgi:RNA recognition motif-containing protein
VKKLFVGNLPADSTEESLSELFAPYGTVRSVSVVTDVFTRKCRGFGFIEMEGHEARAAMAGLDGKDFKGKSLRVRYEEKDMRGGRRGHGRRR